MHVRFVRCWTQESVAVIRWMQNIQKSCLQATETGCFGLCLWSFMKPCNLHLIHICWVVAIALIIMALNSRPIFHISITVQFIRNDGIVSENLQTIESFQLVKHQTNRLEFSDCQLITDAIKKYYWAIKMIIIVTPHNNKNMLIAVTTVLCTATGCD